MKSIEIKNMRCLKDTGIIELPPITILVGENSSGKSTFLRSFPLLKQSFCKRKNGPILWTGDYDDYVDFGSFSETITRDSSRDISFRFEFNLPREMELNPIQELIFRQYDIDTENAFGNANVVYTIIIASDGKREFVSKLEIILGQTEVIFSRAHIDDMASISIDGMVVDIPELRYEFDMRPAALLGLDGASCAFEFIFPNISGLFVSLQDKIVEGAFKEKNVGLLGVGLDFGVVAQYIGAQLCTGKTIEDIIKKRGKRSSKTGKNILNIFPKIEERIMSMAPSQKQLTLNRFKLIYVYSRLSQIDEYITHYFRQVHYIAPLRATAERYYRLRNLAIDEIDFQGKNLAVFLNSLAEDRLKAFQNWTQKMFSFQIKPRKSEGHISIGILTADGQSINLSDTGFGYSQILPIITQLWELSTRKREGVSVIPLVVAIEQPELHLHPAMQAKLVDAFIGSIQLAKDCGYQLQLLLETHSETIINRFGRAVAMKEIESNDLSVITFQKNRTTNLSSVRVSQYDEEGLLTNWPVGFFSPEE